MKGYTEDSKVDMYGDGSYTSPTVWWAALGGFGIWMASWPNQTEVHNGIEAGPQQQYERRIPHLQQPEQSSSNSSVDIPPERGQG